MIEIETHPKNDEDQTGGINAGISDGMDEGHQAQTVEDIQPSTVDQDHQSIGVEQEEVTSPSSQLDQLLRENAHLQTMLAASREETETVAKLLEWNKQTTGAALTHLKDEYDLEKSLVLDTMQTLKRLTKELKSMKRELSTFSTLQDVFTERCEQYRAEIDGLKEQLTEVDEDRRSLSSLLNMAIKQKLDLRLRVEDLEIEKEVVEEETKQKPRRGRGGASNQRDSFLESSKHDQHTIARDFCCTIL